MSVRVVKIGGAALQDGSWLAGFAESVAAVREPLVIVHGGGPEISALSDRLGVQVEWHEGRRVTPAAALDVAAMVLTGRINKRIVSVLLQHGVDAVGLSGVDGALIRAGQVEGGALGRVGSVRSVRAELLHALIGMGLVPVISPLSLGDDGDGLNVNADDAAAAVAAALNAAELLFLTDVPGVRTGTGLVTSLDAEGATALVASGTATGGMAVKLGAAVRALESGVAAIRIGDNTVLADAMAGTVLRPALAGAA